jgi:dihydroorotate dehydrogenase (NAD+) catalytic subunit
MSVRLCGLELEHAVINGSGTFDAIAALSVFGDQLLDAFPFSAYVSKTITLRPRAGNPGPRLWETAGGMINSIGLPNRGLAGYVEHDLPVLARLPVPLITNVMGSDAAELSELVAACDARAEIAAVELNVSCPNVATGLDIGADPRELQAVVAAVRRHIDKPLIVKLTPNTADVAACAAGAQAGGADAVSLINTLRAMALKPGTRDREPWLGGRTGGLSGPAIRTVALAQVAAVAARVDIPIVGMGGVQTSAHAQDLLDAGATAVAVGTETFRDPAAGARIANGLREMSAKSGQSRPVTSG